MPLACTRATRYSSLNLDGPVGNFGKGFRFNPTNGRPTGRDGTDGRHEKHAQDLKALAASGPRGRWFKSTRPDEILGGGTSSPPLPPYALTRGGP
jgi:hypothetical protein